jgi:Recombinase
MTTTKLDRRRDPATTAKGRATANRVVLDKAIDAYRVITPFILNLHGSGKSLGSIATSLNAAGHRTREGAAFSPKTIARIIARSSPASKNGGES